MQEGGAWVMAERDSNSLTSEDASRLLSVVDVKNQKGLWDKVELLTNLLNEGIIRSSCNCIFLGLRKSHCLSLLAVSPFLHSITRPNTPIHAHTRVFCQVHEIVMGPGLLKPDRSKDPWWELVLLRNQSGSNGSSGGSNTSKQGSKSDPSSSSVGPNRLELIVS